MLCTAVFVFTNDTLVAHIALEVAVFTQTAVLLMTSLALYNTYVFAHSTPQIFVVFVAEPAVFTAVVVVDKTSVAVFAAFCHIVATRTVLFVRRDRHREHEHRSNHKC